MNKIARAHAHLSVCFLSSRLRAFCSDSITADVANAKITAQWPLSKKVGMATTIFDNNGTREELNHVIDTWNEKHKLELENQPWWKKWVPTPPTVVLSIMAAPVLFTLNALTRWCAL